MLTRYRECRQCDNKQDVSYWQSLPGNMKWIQRKSVIFQVKRRRDTETGAWRYSMDTVCKDCRNGIHRRDYAGRPRSHKVKHDGPVKETVEHTFFCRVVPTCSIS